MLLAGSFLVGCKQTEQDDLAKAQQCLDEVPQSNPEAASACFQYAEKYDSQQADILKCSILMTSGGLIESKVVEAYKILNTQANVNREAGFMSVLALNKPTVNDGYQKAKDADVFCQKSGVPGLKYISGLIVVGSSMAFAINSLPSPPDFNDPAAVSAATTTLVNNCNADPRVDCPIDSPVLATTVATLAQGYCASADPEDDDEVCSNLSVAVESANGDSAKIGNALMCYLGNKTYNAALDKCN